MASSPNSLLLASVSDRTVRLWNAKTGKNLQRLEGHTKSVEACHSLNLYVVPEYVVIGKYEEHQHICVKRTCEHSRLLVKKNGFLVIVLATMVTISSYGTRFHGST